VQVVPRQCALAAPALLPFQQPLSTSQEACSQQQSAAGPAMYVAAAKQRCVCPLLVNGSFDWGQHRRAQMSHTWRGLQLFAHRGIGCPVPDRLWVSRACTVAAWRSTQQLPGLGSQGTQQQLLLEPLAGSLVWAVCCSCTVRCS
jgi:hypothetical protein